MIDDNDNDEILNKIERGLPSISQAAIAKARETGTYLVVWRDGKIVKLSPDDPSLSDVVSSSSTNL